MAWPQLTAWFFGGAFLMNAVPHLVSGVRGEPFQSPFAHPPGKGLSSSAVNVLWGCFNLVVAYALVWHVGDFDMRNPVHAATFGFGGLAIGLFLARHFGRFHGGRKAERP
jgi:hypothetical protein